MIAWFAVRFHFIAVVVLRNDAGFEQIVLLGFRRPLLTGFLAAAAIIISVSQFKYFFYNASVRACVACAFVFVRCCLCCGLIALVQTHIGDYPTVYEMLYHIFEHIKEVRLCERDLP